jgi:hypothetical protein
LCLHKFFNDKFIQLQRKVSEYIPALIIPERAQPDLKVLERDIDEINQKLANQLENIPVYSTPLQKLQLSMQNIKKMQIADADSIRIINTEDFNRMLKYHFTYNILIKGLESQLIYLKYTYKL